MALVERHKQAALLRHGLAEAAEGAGRVIVVAGGIAVGKSALMVDFLTSAESTAGVILSAVASPGERGHTLGIVRQLLHSAPPAAGIVGPPSDAAAASRESRETEADVAAAAAYEFYETVLALTGTGPVVIAVDDVDHADQASLECLLFLARRLRSAPILMLLNEPALRVTERVPFHSELSRLPFHSRLRLLPLCSHGTREMLARHLPADVAGQLAPAVHEVTGGNPMLVRALVDDHDRDAPQPAVGTAFEDAYVTCVHRNSSELLRVVHALAVLGPAAGRAAVGRLAAVDRGTVSRMLDVLVDSGLIAPDGAFRHAQARTAVLRCGGQQGEGQLYSRAAQILHEEGGSATDVAHCLQLALMPPPAWSVPVLQAAARSAIAADDPHLAAQHLRLAYQADLDSDDSLAVQAQLASVEWQLNPATAERHLTELMAGAAQNRLSASSVSAVVKQLAWQGRVEEAVVTLGQATTSGVGNDPETVAALDATDRYLSYLYPDLAGSPPKDADVVGNSRLDYLRSAFTMVRSALGNAPADDGLVDVEVLLQSFQTRPARAPGEAVLAALETLLYTDALHEAERWSAVIHEQANHRSVPTWRAIFAGLRAEVAFRRGDLGGAIAMARHALADLPLPGWGVAVGGPLSTLILAATAVGDLQEATAALELPVPPAMMRTLPGIRYRYARGRYHLATNRLQAALTDFRDCGRLMQAWGIDQPALVPWRTDAVLTLLRLGQPLPARELAEEDLRRSNERRTRSRALTLRALGMTDGSQRSAGLLTEAAEIFEECGDRLELAYTLSSLGEAHRAAGNAADARIVLHQAALVASECGAEVARRRILPYRQRGAEQERNAPTEMVRLTELSEAERRVALLAAHGLTNREISARLYITMSTVEQHLTRVYRKLCIKSRNDLPSELMAGLARTA